jgi:hypothetical protein
VPGWPFEKQIRPEKTAEIHQPAVIVLSGQTISPGGASQFVAG